MESKGIYIVIFSKDIILSTLIISIVIFSIKLFDVTKNYKMLKIYILMYNKKYIYSI